MPVTELTPGPTASFPPRALAPATYDLSWLNHTPHAIAVYASQPPSPQTIANQRRDLTAAAERHGWQIIAEFCDEGISGAKGRDKRPGFDRLCRAITRHEFDIIAAWSVDRLSRSLPDLLTTKKSGY